NAEAKRRPRGPLFARNPDRDLPEQSAHHVAGECAGSAASAGVTTAAAAAGVAHMARVGRGFVVGRGRVLVLGAACQIFGDQGGVLVLVEVAGRLVAAHGLPALDHAAGLIVKLAGDAHVKAELGEAALHVTTLAPVEADLVLGDLIAARDVTAQ